MPMDIMWYLPGRVILMRSQGHITQEEAHAANEQIKTFFDQKTQPFIHTIVDQTGMLSFPLGLRTLQDSFSMINNSAAGWVLVFGSQNQVANFITSTLAQLGRLKYRQVKNLEEAINFLKHVDPPLAPLLDEMQSASRS